MATLHDIEALIEEIERESASELVKTASQSNQADICAEARKVAHALRNAPLSDSVDVVSVLDQLEKTAGATARQYFGCKKEVFKPVDWEDGVFILSGGNYEY